MVTAHAYMLQVEVRRYSVKLMDLLPSDSGNYSCLVVNRHGQLSHSYELDVFSMYNSLTYHIMQLTLACMETVNTVVPTTPT